MFDRGRPWVPDAGKASSRGLENGTRLAIDQVDPDQADTET